MTVHEDMPRVVLDTNVVLDWLVFHDPRVAALAAAIESRRLRWLGSPQMLDELAHVLGRRLFDAWPHDAKQVLGCAAGLVFPCAEPPSSDLPCSDAADQVFIDLALAQRAAWLFTRDKALLRLARRARLHGTTVCAPDGWT